MLPKHVPSATYRVQLNSEFRFADLLKYLDYFQELGISDLYLSPILASRKGSTHGYDVVDPTRIDADLGTEDEFNALQSELQKRGMGLLLDIVPNHMAASLENPWWMDVLENGAQSAFASFFDVDWQPHARSLEGKILLPVLGRPFGEVIDSSEIKLLFNDARFFFQYFDSLFPLAPRTYHAVLNHRFERLREAVGEDSPSFQEYAGILASAMDLARPDRRVADTLSERRLRFESVRDRLRTLIINHPEVSNFLEGSISEINGREGDPASFGTLQKLLAEQNYKLAFWQNLNESINYRRFFTIADLVGVRVEDPMVFEATHSYVLRLVAKNPHSGVRIDHIDGLRDPLAYLNKLQERLASDEGHAGTPSYVLVEKILARNESLPPEWPVSGTTGYEFLNAVNGILVEPEGGNKIEQIYSEFLGHPQVFAEVLYQKKKLVMDTLLGVEMRTLGRQLAELAAQDRYARELDRNKLIDALIEVTACLPVYRTYIRNMEVPAHAVDNVEKAIECARRRTPHLTPGFFNFVREVLLLLNPPHVLPDHREARLTFVMRWQQFTGPIVAKGLEDTALYVYHPLLSLNDVGGDPFPADALSRPDFFRLLEERLRRWPAVLNTTSTHDTKRSEDVRARLNVLSEIPDEWKTHLNRWAGLNERYKSNVARQPVPDPNEEYFLYQTLLGIWPLEEAIEANLLERVQSHLIKATREAMVHTRWTRPNQPHEEALRQFATQILSPENREFMADFLEFQTRIAYIGMLNGLSQTLLKIAAPGVADFYQGCELWDLHLVDPDNRGLVNLSLRAAALDKLKENASASELVRDWRDGRIKLYLTWKALRFRRDHCDIFRAGEFIALEVAGCHADNIVAFVRKTPTSSALVVVPRWMAKVPAGSGAQASSFDWCDTRIRLHPDAAREWASILTTSRIAASEQGGDLFFMAEDLFRDFPVALLHS